ncbi:hypothetical protein ASPZODRAFT_15321 [Penicilliopsis zonata CBS 506.65]|uniref:Probable endonuclease LCL3 n=1 Tax=Penicilliopsis zonata CBS 506.65 TaxID=1073090 RepID=A0A1L9SL77_9EURO|nr:hypothetical protein ASPZODRAFT_15321 [Penicilliopsis zonata CBS 506.65]OJJ47873.1 hypothetical protein ASPZODRAFT_15321 [Penicilliopsis zonata CBS 506.65]
MRWPPWTSNTNEKEGKEDKREDKPPSSKKEDKAILHATDWAAFTESRTLIPTAILTSAILLTVYVRTRVLRRFRDAPSIPSEGLRRRSVFGQVTSVGDGDNFRLYHTPGGRLAGWGSSWKKVPTAKKELKDETIHIRLAGVDAPELAHFGRPAQPYAREAHVWLTSYLLDRRVRAYLHRHDQYGRVVASVYVRRGFELPLPFVRRDVSYEMLRRGLATVYEAKQGAEFGGPAKEIKYRNAERWARLWRKGLWKDYHRKGWESPRDYKNRMGMSEQETKNGV